MSDNATQTVNKLRRDFFGIMAGTVFHAGADTPIATANANDLASLITLANAMASSFTSHVSNLVDATAGTGVHGANSGESVPNVCTDLGTAAALLNSLNQHFRAHARNKSAHFHEDTLAAFTFVPTDPTLLSAMCNWANALKTAINGHYAAAMNAQVAA